MEKAGIHNVEPSTQELKDGRKRKDRKDCDKLIETIGTTMNPFEDVFQDSNLYSIGSGKSVSQNIAVDLPKMYETGKVWAEAFKNECMEDETRFQKPIKRRKVLNFMADAAKLKMKSKNAKQVLEIKGTRDLFGRLLYLAVTSNVDLQIVFNYPLTPVPLSLGNIDGSMNKTPKSSLKKKLEAKVESTEPAQIDELVINLMFLIRSLTNLPMTFKGIAERILSLACRSSANRIHLFADRYDSVSIKCLEQE